MSRLCFRNKQPFWYALYSDTTITYDEYGNENGTSVTYGNPVKTYGNISPARGGVIHQQFGEDEQYDKEIALSDRDTPINEYAVLWLEVTPELDANGALKVNANGEIVTPWDYIVRRVARGLPNFGTTLIGVSKVNVSSRAVPGPVSV